MAARMKGTQGEASMKVNEPNTGSNAALQPTADQSRTRLLRSLLIISIIADIAALAAAAAGGFGWSYIIPIGTLLLFAIGSLIALLRGFSAPAQILLPPPCLL